MSNLTLNFFKALLISQFPIYFANISDFSPKSWTNLFGKFQFWDYYKNIFL